MRLIKFLKDVKIDGDSDLCKKGKSYVVSDGFLQQIKDNFGEQTLEGIYPFQDIPEKKYNGQDLTGKTLVVWRTGGMGDLCFITPNLRYIKETYKDSKIFFGCGSRFKYGMMNHPHVDKLLPLPIDYDYVLNSDYYLMFEGIIENNEMARKINAYDLFENAFGFTGKISKEKKRPILGISEEHLKKAQKLFKDSISSAHAPETVPIIGLGLRASHIIRSIIPSHLHHMMGAIIQRGALVALMGGKDDKDIANSLPLSAHPHVIHCYKDSLDYRDGIAQISLLSGLIGPDSSSIHIAAAFEKPIVGLYGAFPSVLRMAYYKNASGFDSKLPCGPCFLHGIETCEYSDAQSKEPLCMNMHNPDIVVQEMFALLLASIHSPTVSTSNAPI